MTRKTQLTTAAGIPVADNQNSLTAGERGPVQSPAVKEPPLSLEGPADRYDHRAGNDDYTQAGNLFRLMGADEQQRLINNIVAAMGTRSARDPNPTSAPLLQG